MTADQLYKLPQDLTDELLKAVELLDGSHMLEVISRISEIDNELGERLGRIAKNLQYEELLRILQNLERRRAS